MAHQFARGGDHVTTTLPSDQRSTHGHPVAVLGRLEARRFLTSIPLWCGAALTVLLWATTDPRKESWVGATWSEFVGIAPTFMCIGAFVAASLIGMRDQFNDSTPVTGAAPVSSGDRVLARLLGGTVPVLVVTILAAAVVVYIHWIGGVVVGNVLHTPAVADVVMIPVLAALAVTSGIAAGQLVRSRPVVTIGGSIVIFFTSVMSWVFDGGRTDLTPAVPYQPAEVSLGVSFDPSTAPSGWIISPPDQDANVWRRASFEPAALWFHSLYVLGLALLFAALARRAHGPSRAGMTLTILGTVAALTGGVMQFVVRTGTYV